jgi:hypothetical protein
VKRRGNSGIGRLLRMCTEGNRLDKTAEILRTDQPQPFTFLRICCSPPSTINL